MRLCLINENGGSSSNHVLPGSQNQLPAAKKSCHIIIRPPGETTQKKIQATQTRPYDRYKTENATLQQQPRQMFHALGPRTQRSNPISIATASN